MTLRQDVTARQRELRRFWARAERLTRWEGCTLAEAARILRRDGRRSAQLARGEITPAVFLRGFRVSREVRP